MRPQPSRSPRSRPAKTGRASATAIGIVARDPAAIGIMAVALAREAIGIVAPDREAIGIVAPDREAIGIVAPDQPWPTAATAPRCLRAHRDL
jgi:hypothetical protein